MTVSKKADKDQESIQSSTTPDPGHHMGKRRKHHKQESPHEVSPFPADDHKAARNRQDSITKTITKHKYKKRIHKNSNSLEQSVGKLLESLNIFHGIQQYIQLSTGAKEIQQFNPGGSDNRHSIRPQPSNLYLSL